MSEKIHTKTKFQVTVKTDIQASIKVKFPLTKKRLLSLRLYTSKFVRGAVQVTLKINYFGCPVVYRYIGFPLRVLFFWKPMQRLIFTNNRPTCPGFQDDWNDRGKALKQTKAPQITQNQYRIPAKETIKVCSLFKEGKTTTDLFSSDETFPPNACSP